MNEKSINQKAVEYARPLYAEMRKALACPNEADLAEAYKKGFRDCLQNIVTNVPKLKWEDCPGGYEARTTFLCYRIYVNEQRKKKYTLKYPNSVLKECLHLASAKQLACEDYKERLKEELGM